MGGGSPGSWEHGWTLEQAGAWAPERLTGAARKACDLELQLASLHLVGKSFLGRWDSLRRKQGDAPRTCSGAALLCVAGLSLPAGFGAESRSGQPFSQLLWPVGFLVFSGMARLFSSFNCQLQRPEEPKLDPQEVSVNDCRGILSCQSQPSGIYSLTRGPSSDGKGDGARGCV